MLEKEMSERLSERVESVLEGEKVDPGQLVGFIEEYIGKEAVELNVKKGAAFEFLGSDGNDIVLVEDFLKKYFGNECIDPDILNLNDVKKEYSDEVVIYIRYNKNGSFKITVF